VNVHAFKYENKCRQVLEMIGTGDYGITGVVSANETTTKENDR
jgi:hypothetical protein